MKCPNCGYKRQKRDDAFVPATECPSCGIVYSKHEGAAVPGLPISKMTAPAPMRPSAVDPESLKKAKDRVEKKLRNRLETPVRDKRHAQTLELARKMTGRATRKRQNQEDKVQKDEKAQVEEVSKASEKIETQTEDPLLLEDAIGVQIHNGQNDITPEVSVDETPTHETTSDEMDIEASDESIPDEQDAPLAEDPETDRASDYPEDVQVETVLLASAEQKVAEPSEHTSEPDEWTTLDESIEQKATDLPPAYVAAESTPQKTLHLAVSLKRLLPIIAWLILFSGVIGAVLSWTTITDVEAGVNIPGSSVQGALPLGLLLGFAYLATGALGFAFFWVASLINRQLKDIRRLLMVHPIAMFPGETVSGQADGVKSHKQTENQNL